ncbi:uncharacterized protein B0H64DRAFT_45015 [Chaetomium fimeti]|uniref:Uncharacterized protein n=1 Tax=Chaetomium fimeti TaxID=1854472 RepID=A0AAE0H7E5_9PEZI|nr:hypothetical protein B0H64DRAFT_45015 [Chaetomium fimeti]
MPNRTLRQPEGAVPPAAFLFHSAWPPTSEFHIRGSLMHRQTDGTTCGADETTCPQGGWCCGAGETCSIDNGAFFCCPAGAGAGCARVCAVGDFQCGSICCANGQTCMGADTLSPFCVIPEPSSVAPTTTPSSRTTTTSQPSSTSSSSSISTSTTHTSKPTSTAAHSSTTIAASPTATDQPSPPKATDTSTTSATPQQGGLTHPAQIAIGIIVPIAVVFLVGALWFLIFRRPGRGRGHRRGGTGDTSFGFGTGSRGPTPPPAYSKAGLDATSEPPLSMHEQYMMEANAERGREGPAVGEGFEMADLRTEGHPTAGQTGVHTDTQPGAGPGDVSPLSDDSGSRGRASPHPGIAVAV